MPHGSIRTLHDPEWNNYEMSLPDKKTREEYGDQLVLEALSKYRDRFEIPRQVDFEIAFSSFNNGDSAAAAATSAGFSWKTDSDGLGALATKTIPITLSSIASARNELRSALSGIDATVTGWGCHPQARPSVLSSLFKRSTIK